MKRGTQPRNESYPATMTQLQKEILTSELVSSSALGSISTKLSGKTPRLRLRQNKQPMNAERLLLGIRLPNTSSEKKF